MRAAHPAYYEQLSHATIEPRFIIGIGFDNDFTDVWYFTSHADSPLPDGASVYASTIVRRGISAVTQSVDFETGATTIGGATIKLSDRDLRITTLINTKLTAGDGIRHKPVKVWHVPSPGLSWREVGDYPAFSMIITRIKWRRGTYIIECATRNLLARKTICIPKKDNLVADFPPEMVTGGDLSSAAGWTFNAGWSHDSGNGEADASAASTDLERSVAFTNAATYLVTYTIKNYSAGSVTVKAGGTAGTARNANGTYTESIVAGAGGLIEITGAGFTGSVDNVSARLATGGTEIAVANVTKFARVQHGAAWSDGPSATVGYVKVNDEVLRYGTIDSANNKLQTLATGRFGTLPADHRSGTEADVRRRTQVVEWIYYEMPAIKLLLMLLTGGIHVPATAFASWPKAPAHHHAGVSINDIDLASFEGIGADLWDPADDTKGRLAFANGLDSIDCKTWIEKELCVLAGVVLMHNAHGQFTLKRITQVPRDAAPLMVIGTSTHLNVIEVDYAFDKVHTRYLTQWAYDAAVLRSYRREHEVYDTASSAKWNATAVRKQAFAALAGSLDTERALNQQFRTYHGKLSSPGILITVEVPHPLLGLELLDVVGLRSTQLADFFTGASLDRSFEILNIATDWWTGKQTLQMFGSTGRPLDEANWFSDATVLSDSFYGAAGTSLTAYLAANYPGQYTDSAGTLTITGTVTLPGGTTSYMRYYYHGNLTQADGSVLNITGNVQRDIRGVITQAGTTLGKGGGRAGAAPGTLTTTTVNGVTRKELPVVAGESGLIGNSIATSGLTLYKSSTGKAIATTIDTVTAKASVGKYGAAPYFVLKNNGNSIEGLPSDGRGSSGGSGGTLVDSYNGTAAATFTAGGAGGDSGASLVDVCRGFVYTGSGYDDLSGDDGGVGGAVSAHDPANGYAVSGAGGGGTAGLRLILLDGASVLIPDLNAGTVRSKHGKTPVYPNGTEVPRNELHYVSAGEYAQSAIHGSSTAQTAWESTASFQFIPPQQTAVADPYPTTCEPATNLVLASGDSEIEKLTDGTVLPRIKVSWSASPDKRLHGYRVEYKLSSASLYTGFSGLIPAGVETVYINNIKSGQNYDVRVYAANVDGYKSVALTQTNYLALGLLAKPPDCTGLTVTRLPDGTRRFVPAYSSLPVDFAGFLYRYVSGTGGTWSGMTAINTVAAKSNPFETVEPKPAGAYTFGVKMADTTGNESTNAATVEVSALDGRMDTHMFLASNWTERSNPKNVTLYDVAYSPELDLYVAVGDADGTDAYIVTSADAQDWTERSNPKNIRLDGICWAGALGLFVAVGHQDGTDAYIVTSADGATWTERANPSNQWLYDVVWNGSLLVAVGFGGAGVDSYIITSTDGINWTERTNPKNSLQLNGICWDGAQFVAVGSAESFGDAYIVTSPDGTTWTERANPKSVTLYAVAYSPQLDLFIAVGQDDGSDAYMLSSSDGATWSEVSNLLNISQFDIVWSGAAFVTAGAFNGPTTYLLTSPDGIDWIPRRCNKRKALRGCCWSGEAFVQVGDADGTDAYLLTSLYFRQ